MGEGPFLILFARGSGKLGVGWCDSTVFSLLPTGYTS